MIRLPTVLRWMARRLLRFILHYSPVFMRNAAVRMPFSRFHWILPCMFWGQEQITWRNVEVIVNPGAVLGYYPYFLGDYSGDEIDLLVKLGSDAHVFADVGANSGLITLAVAQACPNLHIYAFEPDPIIVARFNANLQLNKSLLSRITLIQKAVADIDGTLNFHSEADKSNPETGRLVDSTTSSSHMVQSTRLDTFFAALVDKPDMVKIDVEGAELSVLRGMNGLFTDDIPSHILVEVHAFYLQNEDRSHFNQQIESELLKAGYKLYNMDGSIAPSSNQWPSRIHINGTLETATT